MRTLLRRVLPAVVTCVVAFPAVAEEAISYKPLVTPIVAASTTILGQPFAYPSGQAKLTAVIVTLPPGTQTGWHSHEVPLFGYILDGELTVDYGDRGLRTYDEEAGFIEAIDWSHSGMNRTTEPVRILAVYAGAEGVPNATADEAIAEK